MFIGIFKEQINFWSTGAGDTPISPDFVYQIPETSLKIKLFYRFYGGKLNFDRPVLVKSLHFFSVASVAISIRESA
jgi:hypothetical protein